MTGAGLICRLENISKIEGADRIVRADFKGETVIVSNDMEAGTLGILFDCETQLSDKFASSNNLYRHNEYNADKSKKGYLEDHRRVRPIKMRGVKVSAFFMPIDSLDFTKGKISALKEGMYIEEFNKTPICSRYVVKRRSSGSTNKIKGKSRENLVPEFREHVDTDHVLRCLDNLRVGDLAILTTKLHGTSARVGYLPLARNSWYDKLLKKFSLQRKTEHVFCVGSRRVVKYIEGQTVKQKGSYYNEDVWTHTANEHFKDKLLPGEEVYYEIVGYLPSGELIMPSCDNKKLKQHLDKEEYKQFIADFGETTQFLYGATEKTKYKIFVYRITQNGRDLTWKQVKLRSEEMCVPHVPEIDTFFITEEHKKEDWWKDRYEDYHCSHFPENVREGVVLRLETGNPQPKLFKYKNFVFKVLENIIKDTTDNIEEEN